MSKMDWTIDSSYLFGKTRYHLNPPYSCVDKFHKELQIIHSVTDQPPNTLVFSFLITDSGNEKQGKEHALVTIGWSVVINSPN